MEASEPQTARQANQQIARATGTVMLAFVLSNVIGLARTILISSAFGTGAEIDAFNTANRVVETLFNLVAGGALSSAFIPTFSGFLARDDHKGAWRLASAITNWVLIALVVLSLVAAVFARELVQYLLAPAFVLEPAKFELTVLILRVILPAATIFGISGLLMGILNAHQVFWIPALTPSMYGLGMIFGVVVLAPRFGIFGLAYGVLIGALMHLLIQIPALRRLRGSYRLTLGFDLPEVGEVARLMGPRLFGVAIVQLNFWVNIRLATRMMVGSVTAINNAFTLMMMPEAVIAQSIAIASLPTFSMQVAKGHPENMRTSLAASLRSVLLLSVPASVGMVLLRVPLVQLLLQRDVFDERSTALVAWALLWYGIGLVGHCVVEVISRAFYALHDTKTPVGVGIVAMSLNVVFSLAFSNLFTRLGWAPHGGLALANSLATGLEMTALLVLMRRRLHGLHGSRILRGFGEAAAGSLVMAVVLVLWLHLTAGRSPWWIGLGGTGIGAAVYAVMVVILRVPELGQLVGVVKRRINARSANK